MNKWQQWLIYSGEKLKLTENNLLSLKPLVHRFLLCLQHFLNFYIKSSAFFRLKGRHALYFFRIVKH